MSRIIPLAGALAAWAIMGCASTTDPDPVPAVNVALEGTASASAVWQNNPTIGPEMAIDGSSHEDSTAPNYWILPNRTAGWWQVDLGRDCDISSIEIFNTHNGAANDRGTKDFRVEIQDSSRTVVFTYTGALPFMGQTSAARPIAPYTVKPGKPKSGRIVKIHVLSWHPTRSDPSWPHPVTPSSDLNEGGGLNEVRVLGTPGK